MDCFLCDRIKLDCENYQKESTQNFMKMFDLRNSSTLDRRFSDPLSTKDCIEIVRQNFSYIKKENTLSGGLEKKGVH